MTIKEVEEATGLSRSNIRFYEKEDLIRPGRNVKNGYRDYSREDIDKIKKIAYLRTLDISVEEIGKIISGEISLINVVKKQRDVLTKQIEDMENALELCERMLKSKDINFEKLDVEAFIPDMDGHWARNRSLLKIDTVGFIYLWGGSLVWGILTVLCLLAALLSFTHLPERIPVQWSHGQASSLVNRGFIFAYPLACIVLRFLIRPFIWRWLQLRINAAFGDVIADYITNYLCFIALSVELFTLLFVVGIVQHVTIVIAVDTVVLMGVLLVSWVRIAKSIRRR